MATAGGRPTHLPQCCIGLEQLLLLPQVQLDEHVEVSLVIPAQLLGGVDWQAHILGGTVPTTLLLLLLLGCACHLAGRLQQLLAQSAGGVSNSQR